MADSSNERKTNPEDRDSSTRWTPSDRTPLRLAVKANVVVLRLADSSKTLRKFPEQASLILRIPRPRGFAGAPPQRQGAPKFPPCAPPGSSFPSPRIEGEDRRVWPIPVLAAAILLLWGCIAIPTPEHGGPYIAEEAFQSLEAGRTSRTEILVRFGEPTERLQGDRFLVYPWERVAGYVVVGGYGAGAIGGWTRGHVLCLEFTPGGMLKRFVHLEGIGSENLRRRLEAWMAEP